MADEGVPEAVQPELTAEPRIGRTRNLAWGLAAVAMTFVAVLVLGCVGMNVLIALWEARALDAVIGGLPPQAEPRLSREAIEMIGLLSLFGPWLAAGVLVGRRERWPVALQAGAVSAGLFMGIAIFADPSAAGLEEALGFGVVSVAAGLTAAVPCAVRQRWRC